MAKQNKVNVKQVKPSFVCPKCGKTGQHKIDIGMTTVNILEDNKGTELIGGKVYGEVRCKFCQAVIGRLMGDMDAVYAESDA